MNCNYRTLMVMVVVLSGLGLALATGSHSEPIEPTRNLQTAADEHAILNVYSEPPALEVELNGKTVGKTPLTLENLIPGFHSVRIKGAETKIQLTAGQPKTISWFKGVFIAVPEKVKRPEKASIESEPKISGPKPIKGSLTTPEGSRSDPYYWPLNPKGPIY